MPITNNRFDIKHIAGDYGKSALPDPQVYIFATKKKRILVTFNIKDFRPLVSSTKLTGVVGVSPHLSLEQIDKKITSLLSKSGKKSLFGKLTIITGET